MQSGIHRSWAVAKILIIEDDEIISEQLDTWLVGEKHTVEAVVTGEDGLYRLQYFDYDLAIVDWNLPDIEGVEICRSIRDKKPHLPLLIMTSRRNIEDKITGLDSGALDYLVKPCALEELSARIRALLRRTGEVLPSAVTFADLELNPVTREAVCNSQAIKFTPMEFDIVMLLTQRKDEIIDAERIAKAMGKEYGTGVRQTINTRLSTIRQKLKQADSRSSIEYSLENGYTLVEKQMSES